MTNTKTHYRRVFKSDHLSVADLEDFQEERHNLIFTINNVQQLFGAKVAGKKIDANIAYFDEKIKPLVINATNGKAMLNLTGSKFVEDWSNVKVQLYIDPTARLKGETVGGVRISPSKPQERVKQDLAPESDKWQGAVGSVAKLGNADLVLQHFNVTEENIAKLYEQANVS